MQIHAATAVSSYYPVSRPEAAQPAAADAQAVAAASDQDEERLSEAQDVDESSEQGQEQGSSDSSQTLTDEEFREVQLLKERDSEVRAHEQAHMAAGGAYVTGGASYSYQTGPDGQRYAIGGEVGIDTSMPSDPEASLQKARTLIQAALAPAEPSAQDHRVAASARAMEIKAAQDLQEQQVDRQKQAGEEVVSGAESRIRSGSDAGTADEDASTGLTSDSESARKTLEARISAFFAAPSASNLSQFA